MYKIKYSHFEDALTLHKWVCFRSQLGI